MKKKLAVLGTAIMAAVAITACGGTQTQTTEAETTTQAPAAIQDSAATQEQTTVQDSAESQAQSTQAGDTSSRSSESPSEEGADLDVSEIKPFAQKVQKAVADKDMDALADLCAYPLYVSLKEGEGNEVADKDALLKLDGGKIFTDHMLKEIADTDVDSLEQFGAGVIMGNENTIIFNNVIGHAAVTAITVQ